MEAAVIGPDPERTELVKAFVVLCAGHQPTPEQRTNCGSITCASASVGARLPAENRGSSRNCRRPQRRIAFLLRNQESPGNTRKAAPRCGRRELIQREKTTCV